MDNILDIMENVRELQPVVFIMMRAVSWIFRKGSFPLFVIVGGFNTLFGYSVFAVGIYCGLHYAAASLLAYVLGTTFNFFTTGRIVFENAQTRLIGRFVAVYIFMYFLNLSLIKCNSYLIDNMYINGFIVTLVMAVVSFFLNKNIVFRK